MIIYSNVVIRRSSPSPGAVSSDGILTILQAGSVSTLIGPIINVPRGLNYVTGSGLTIFK